MTAKAATGVPCRKCGVALAERTGAGRPPWYCSVGCRRSAEYELRRAQTAVEAVEKDIRRHREHVAIEPVYGLDCCGRRSDAVARHLAFLEEERVRLEARMRELLDDAGDAS
jgi:hypothetical protein